MGLFGPQWLAASGAVVDGAPSADGSLVGLFVFIAIALGVSFLCSVLEAVLLSTTSAYLEVAAKRGSHAAERMRRHKEKQNIDRSISAILTLNTIAHTVGAAGAGAEAAAIFGSEWIGVIGAVLTLLILVVSEIIPKTLGAVYWKALNPLSAASISVLVFSLYPVVWACQKLTDLLKPKGDERTVTRAELEILAQLGHQEGTIARHESRVVSNLLRLDRVPIKRIVTPRTVMFALPSTSTLAAAASEPLRFSRIPIFVDTKDAISRFVLRHDILDGLAQGNGEHTLEQISRPLTGVPETMSVGQLLESCIEQQQHIFLVIDEYGGTTGLVTLEDAIESLLGREITDESDTVADMQELARRTDRTPLDDRWR